jgi:hypothetical protein
VAEVLIPLDDVLVWVKRVGPEVALQTLLGCALDDGASESLHVIEGIEVSAQAEPMAFTLRGGVRALTGRLRAAGAAIVESRPGAPLAAAIEAGRTEPERALRAQAHALRKHGIDAARLKSADARGAVLRFMEALDQDSVPDAPTRHAAFDAFKNAEPQMQRLGAQVFKRLAALCAAKGQQAPEDVHWRIACLLRYAGALREAIAESDILNGPSLRDQGPRKILATTRAAALLDLWRVTHEVKLVREADAAFRVAWGIDPDDEQLQALRPVLNRAIEQAGLSDLAPERPAPTAKRSDTPPRFRPSGGA